MKEIVLIFSCLIVLVAGCVGNTSNEVDIGDTNQESVFDTKQENVVGDTTMGPDLERTRNRTGMRERGGMMYNGSGPRFMDNWSGDGGPRFLDNLSGDQLADLRERVGLPENASEEEVREALQKQGFGRNILAET